MIVEIEGKCQFENCDKAATCISVGRCRPQERSHPQISVYCDKHADIVSDEGNPEYQVDCPNCGCQFGVN